MEAKRVSTTIGRSHIIWIRENGNYPVSIASTNTKFHLSDLDECRTAFVLQTNVNLQHRQMDFVLIHQCETISRQCYCKFRASLDFHYNTEVKKPIGFYNSQNQDIVWHNIIDYAIPFVKINGKTIIPHVFESVTFQR